MCLVVAAYLPFESVVLPVYFNERDDPEMLGFVVTAMSAGGIVGALAYPPVVRLVGRRNLFVGAVVSACAALLGLATLPGVDVAAPHFGALTGLLWGPVNPILNLAMQVLSPEHMRGRVIGVVTSAAYAAGPLGLAVAGPLIDDVRCREHLGRLRRRGARDAMVSFLLPLGRVRRPRRSPTDAEPHVGAVPRADDPHLGGPSTAAPGRSEVAVVSDAIAPGHRAFSFDDPWWSRSSPTFSRSSTVRYGGPDETVVAAGTTSRAPQGAFFVGLRRTGAGGDGRLALPARRPGARWLGLGRDQADVRRARGPAPWPRPSACSPTSESRPRAAGADMMVLETGLEQPEAIALYESSGYEPIDAVRLLLGLTPGAVLRQAPLTPPSTASTVKRTGRGRLG